MAGWHNIIFVDIFIRAVAMLIVVHYQEIVWCFCCLFFVLVQEVPGFPHFYFFFLIVIFSFFASLHRLLSSTLSVFISSPILYTHTLLSCDVCLSASIVMALLTHILLVGTWSCLIHFWTAYLHIVPTFPWSLSTVLLHGVLHWTLCPCTIHLQCCP